MDIISKTKVLRISTEPDSKSKTFQAASIYIPIHLPIFQSIRLSIHNSKLTNPHNRMSINNVNGCEPHYHCLWTYDYVDYVHLYLLKRKNVYGH